MASIEPFLTDLLRREIEPSAARMARAVGSHNYLRAQLGTGPFARRIRHSYLSGSYSRDTAIDPIDDVDVVFLIDPQGWSTGFLDRIFGGKPGPDTVLKSFATALRRRYERSLVRTQRRSVGLELSHLRLDVVPAIPDSDPHLIWIPDREKSTWIKSAPLLHKADGEEVNQRRRGLYKPLVKVLKFWNSNLPTTARLKSFTIETMAARIFRSHPFLNLEDGLLHFLDFVMWRSGFQSQNRWSNPCGISITHQGLEVPDIAGTGTNVAARVTSECAKRFMDYTRIAYDRIVAALQAKTRYSMEARMREALRTQ